MVHTYSEILLHFEKEGCPTGYSEREACGHCAESNKPVMKGQILCDSTYMGPVEETKSQRQKVGAGSQGLGREGVSECLMGPECQFDKIKRVLGTVVVMVARCECASSP